MVLLLPGLLGGLEDRLLCDRALPGLGVYKEREFVRNLIDTVSIPPVAVTRLASSEFE